MGRLWWSSWSRIEEEGKQEVGMEGARKTERVIRGFKGLV